MEERKLNFNAPLLSVRRFSGTSSFQDRNKQKKVENPPPTARFALPRYCSDASLDQVTEPVAVPFVWEQIPGKAKGGVEHEFEPDKEAAGAPRLPPGRILKVVKCPVEKECVNQDVVRPQTETYAVNDNVSKLDCLNEGMNEKCVSESDNDDDVYSDALDTLSPTNSISMNCSISGVSGPDAQVAKPSGTFSTDPQTQDFMLQRFLPAAMAMTLETPKYASRKQSVAPGQPREVKTIVAGDRKPPFNQYESAIVPYYNQDVEEEETEDEYDDYQDSGNLSRKACGLLPRLCFKSSLGLLNPVPGLKVRTHSSTSSTREIAKPQKATYLKSRSQIVEKNAWNVVHKNKSDGGVQSAGLPVNKSDSAVQSPRLSKDKPDRGVQSPELLVNRSESAFQSPRLSKNKPDRRVQSPRLLVSKSDSAFQPPRLSKDKSDTEVQRPRLPEIGKELICVSNQFSSSNDQQMLNRSPSKRLPGSGRISPYRRERPQSPFRGGGFLGLPKEAEKYKANMMVKYTRSNNNSRELVPYQSTGQGSSSPSPAVEKTLYVDTVNFAEIATSNSSDTKVQTESIGVNKVLEEPATMESSLQHIKGLNLLDGKGISELEIAGSVKSSPSFSDKPDHRQNGGLDPVFKSLEPIKVRADGNLSHTDDDNPKEADEASAGSDYSPLPPPLPKTPSESWLWRALPSRKSSLQSYNGTRFKPKKHEPEPPATDAKWETIVKTSYLHHDHVRYSEELSWLRFCCSLPFFSFHFPSIGEWICWLSFLYNLFGCGACLGQETTDCCETRVECDLRYGTKRPELLVHSCNHGRAKRRNSCYSRGVDSWYDAWLHSRGRGAKKAERFGPWMITETRRHRPPMRTVPATTSKPIAGNSRFATLEVQDGGNAGLNVNVASRGANKGHNHDLPKVGVEGSGVVKNTAYMAFNPDKRFKGVSSSIRVAVVVPTVVSLDARVVDHVTGVKICSHLVVKIVEPAVKGRDQNSDGQQIVSVDLEGSLHQGSVFISSDEESMYDMSDGDAMTVAEEVEFPHAQ
ncbi:hypothetical protein V6N11_070888 [Hibiscus sabdariffa]|uniref:Uncharacterized protein n=1 Tax=Hibiscus sabdariffa TaxID=183260 RepID=A0ABR1ZGY7_9ROSI